MLPELDYKRIILAILLVVISIGLLFGIIWFVFLRTSGQPTTDEGDNGQAGGSLPTAGTQGQVNIVGPAGQLPGNEGVVVFETGEEVEGYDIYNPSEVAKGTYTQVADLMAEEVSSLNISRDSLSYLSEADDRFYRISLDGKNKTLLSTKDFPFVDKIEWAPNGNKVVLEYPDGSNVVHDFIENKTVTLPKGLEDPSFDVSSEKIAYKFIGGRAEDNWLVVSESDSSEVTVIEPLGDNYDKVQVEWSPTKKVVALYHKSIGLNREEVFFVGLEGENYKSMVVEGSDFKGLWSPGGDKILYQIINADNGYNPTLWIVDADGDNIGNNNFNLGLTTWVDKCVFAGDNTTVYCAVPVGLAEGAGLYPDLLNKSQDIFYTIDLKTGISKLIAYPVLSANVDEFRVEKLIISDDGSNLLFLDGISNRIYSMRLR